MKETYTAIRQSLAHITGVSIDNIVIGGQGAVNLVTDFITVMINTKSVYHPVRERNDGQESLRLITNAECIVDIYTHNDNFGTGATYAALVSRMHRNASVKKILIDANIYMSKSSSILALPATIEAQDVVKRHRLTLPVRIEINPIADADIYRVGESVKIGVSE
jgi:hypothetical protein